MSADTAKSFNKNPPPFLDKKNKSLNEVEREGDFDSLMKNVY